MSISGGVKFFYNSQCLAVDGATIVASSGDSTSENCLDRNPDTYWRSVGSSDVTTETLTITFPDSTTTVTRLLFLDINWKAFTVQYNNAGTWTNFSSVVGLDGSKASITETTFSDSTAYYEVASVSTDSIRIQITSTQTANQEKYCSQVIVTTEIGTLQGYPKVEGLKSDRNTRVRRTLSGKVVAQKSLETFAVALNFENYPSDSTYIADLNVVMTLQDLEDPFLVWLCGGRRGTTYFRTTSPLRGFRLKDVIAMDIVSALPLSYSDNIYTNTVNTRLELAESV